MKKLQFFKNALISLLMALVYIDTCLPDGEISLGVIAGSVGTFCIMMYGMYALDYTAREHAQKKR